MNKYIKIFASSFILVFLFFGVSSVVHAASADISKAYSASSNIPGGELVSETGKKTTTVTPANTTNQQSLLGVSVDADNSLIAVNPSSNTVQVAISGSVEAYVSTVNGDIVKGSEIGASPFNGIGMLAAPSTKIVGVADSALNSKSANIKTESVKTTSGQTKSIVIGYIPVSVEVGQSSSNSDANKLNALQTLVKSVTGKTIPTYRIIISLVIAVVAIVVLVTLVHAAIYGSLVAIGRNPLAKNAVFKTLVFVGVMAIMTAAVSVVTMTLLL